MDDWVTVYSACTASQVYIFKAALEEAGIPTVVENEALQGAYGGFMGTSFSSSMDPQLKVPQSKEAEAKRIVTEIENAPDEANAEESPD